MAFHTALQGVFRQDADIVMIGEMRSQPLGAKDDPDRRITVTIVALTSAEERAPALALMEQIETALDQSRFAAGGWKFGGTFIDDEAALAEDGTSYVGSVVFEFLALKD